MKEASGELNMTLITIVAIGAVLALFFAFKGPIMEKINSIWQDADEPQSYNVDYNLIKDLI